MEQTNNIFSKESELKGKKILNTTLAWAYFTQRAKFFTSISICNDQKNILLYLYISFYLETNHFFFHLLLLKAWRKK